MATRRQFQNCPHNVSGPNISINRGTNKIGSKKIIKNTERVGPASGYKLQKCRGHSVPRVCASTRLPLPPSSPRVVAVTRPYLPRWGRRCVRACAAAVFGRTPRLVVSLSPEKTPPHYSSPPPSLSARARAQAQADPRGKGKTGPRWRGATTATPSRRTT